MSLSSARSQIITVSPYAWERETLDFVRQQLPDHDRAWANVASISSPANVIAGLYGAGDLP